jgi:hypothetical protein
MWCAMCPLSVTQPCTRTRTANADSTVPRAQVQVEVVVVHEPLGVSLMQRGSQVVVSSVEPASMAAVPWAATAPGDHACMMVTGWGGGAILG